MHDRSARCELLPDGTGLSIMSQLVPSGDTTQPAGAVLDTTVRIADGVLHYCVNNPSIAPKAILVMPIVTPPGEVWNVDNGGRLLRLGNPTRIVLQVAGSVIDGEGLERGFNHNPGFEVLIVRLPLGREPLDVSILA